MSRSTQSITLDLGSLVIFPCGYHSVWHRLSKDKQVFFSFSEDTGDVHCFSSSLLVFFSFFYNEYVLFIYKNNV